MQSMAELNIGHEYEAKVHECWLGRHLYIKRMFIKSRSMMVLNFSYLCLMFSGSASGPGSNKLHSLIFYSCSK